MLLMFMVAGIYFLREMLLFTFTKILLGVRSKILLSLLFSFTAAFLSAFLDALTVTTIRRRTRKLSNYIVKISSNSALFCEA